MSCWTYAWPPEALAELEILGISKKNKIKAVATVCFLLQELWLILLLPCCHLFVMQKWLSAYVQPVEKAVYAMLLVHTCKIQYIPALCCKHIIFLLSGAAFQKTLLYSIESFLPCGMHVKVYFTAKPRMKGRYCMEVTAIDSFVLLILVPLHSTSKEREIKEINYSVTLSHSYKAVY